MINRRRLMQAGGAGVLLSLVPVALNASTRSVIREVYGDRKISSSRVNLKTPSLAENGNSVSLEVSVDSPMTEADYVEEIRIFAPKNPQPEMAVFRFTPGAGRASVSTRIRFAESQTIVAVAQMSDGGLYSAASETVITMAACVEPLL